MYTNLFDCASRVLVNDKTCASLVELSRSILPTAFFWRHLEAMVCMRGNCEEGLQRGTMCSMCLLIARVSSRLHKQVQLPERLCGVVLKSSDVCLIVLLTLCDSLVIASNHSESCQVSVSHRWNRRAWSKFMTSFLSLGLWVRWREKSSRLPAGLFYALMSSWSPECRKFSWSTNKSQQWKNNSFVLSFELIVGSAWRRDLNSLITEKSVFLCTCQC